MLVLEEAQELAVWAGWAEQEQEQDLAASVSVHHAVLLWSTGLVFPATRASVQSVELRW